MSCCLGEYGIIAGKCKFDNGGILHDEEGDEDGLLTSSSGELIGSWNELGLYSPDGNRRDWKMLAGGKNMCLATLNDELNTWPEIAAIIRANPELYLSKSV